MTRITALLDKLPHWLVLLVTAFVGGMVSYLTSEPAPALLTAFTTTAGALALLKGAAIAGGVAVVAWLKSPPEGKSAPDTIEAAQAKLSQRGFVRLRVLGAVCLAGAAFFGCAAFLKSSVPSDLQADEECVAAQLLQGKTDPLAIGFACSIPEGKTMTDLLALLVDALAPKLSIAQVTGLRQYVGARRAVGQ